MLRYDIKTVTKLNFEEIWKENHEQEIMHENIEKLYVNTRADQFMMARAHCENNRRF
jgi:hypothetical protein